MAFLDRARNRVLVKIGASNMMNIIYGEERAKKVKLQYNELSARLGELVEQVVYDTFWARAGLSFKDKSIITIISLIALNKKEQLQLHFDSYINLGGTFDHMAQCLARMAACEHVDSVNYHSSLSEFMGKAEFKSLNILNGSTVLAARDKAIVDLTICIALGNQLETKNCLLELIESNPVSIDEIGNIMLHQIMYCGFPCAMNGFAVLRGVFERADTDQMEPVKKSEMMDLLYGNSMSKAVYNRCQELSPMFNKLVQEIVYDVFWRRPGTSVVQKSLVTIITLTALKKEEQLRIHLGGYMNLGETPGSVHSIFSYMKKCGYIQSFDMLISMLKEISDERGLEFDITQETAIDDSLKATVDLISSVALGDRNKISESAIKLLNYSISKNEIENMILHEMMYSGLPCAMIGFSELKKCTVMSDSDVNKLTDKSHVKFSKH